MTDELSLRAIDSLSDKTNGCFVRFIEMKTISLRRESLGVDSLSNTGVPTGRFAHENIRQDADREIGLATTLLRLSQFGLRIYLIQGGTRDSKLSRRKQK